MILTALKWVISTLMALLLIFGILGLIDAWAQKSMLSPTMGELAPIKVTLKNMTIKDDLKTYHVQEYPGHSFAIIANMGAPESAMKAGDKLDFYVKKDDAKDLNIEKLTYVYGVRLSNGDYLINPHDAVDRGLNPKYNARQAINARNAALATIAIPVLYFATLIIFRKYRRERKTP